MFVSLTKSALIGSAWVEAGTPIDLPDDRARKLIAHKHAVPVARVELPPAAPIENAGAKLGPKERATSPRQA